MQWNPHGVYAFFISNFSFPDTNNRPHSQFYRKHILVKNIYY